MRETDEEFLNRVCRHKSAFRTKRKARKHQSGENQRRDHKLRIYKCPHCKNYHLTKNMRRQTKQQRENKSRQMEAMWRDPEYRAKMVEAQKKSGFRTFVV